MRVFVTGATGLLGSLLVDRLLARGDQVVALSRRPEPGPSRTGLSWIAGEVNAPGAWQAQLEGTDAAVHLAAESLDARRWSAAQKERIEQSRIAGTRNLVDAIASARTRPRILVSASGVHAYGARGEEELDESAALGTGFLPALCKHWEEEAGRAAGAGVRTVFLRTGMVLSRRGGALRKLRPPFLMGVGGPLGDPRAWFPWIHEEDHVGIVLHALAGPGMEGPVNTVAPGAVRMGEFARAMGHALHRPAVMPVPGFALRLLLGEMATMVNPGVKVIPRAALAAGYQFVFPALDGALAAALGPSPT